MLRDAAERKCGVPVLSVRILRRAIDARHKRDIRFVFTVAAESRRLSKRPGVSIFTEPVRGQRTYTLPTHPFVIGAGPAGLFAALTLARAGVCPILCERGRPVEKRREDVARFFRGGPLDPNSNVQFGEGGAGAFSDGKLSSGISNPRASDVLETFVRFGAPSEILWDYKPHIGTDRLPDIVAGIRREIIRLGGEFRPETTLTDIRVHDGALTRLSLGEEPTDARYAVLAPGHSARDTFEMLLSRGVTITQKPFSVGARIEHPQSLIDRAQYGTFAGHPRLGAADYKLSTRSSDGRGVYTFCMCPGGTVVAAASEPGRTVTNGMSTYARDGVNANAAVLVGVGVEDFPSDHPLAGVALQRSIEAAAYQVGGYCAPAQTVGGFIAGRPSVSFGSVIPSCLPGVTPADLTCVLPGFVISAMKQGILDFDRRIRGFAMPDAVLTAPETRSSSPVRILRGERCECIGVRGLFPCGEGAGYAGGILSAAVDGIRCAENLLDLYGTQV